MPPHNKKSRSKKTPGGYVRLNRYVMRCDAWKALSPHARCLYLVLLDRHRDYGRGKNNNGKIALSHREAMSGSGCSDRGIRKGFRDLISQGLHKHYEGQRLQHESCIGPRIRPYRISHR